MIKTKFQFCNQKVRLYFTGVLRKFGFSDKRSSFKVTGVCGLTGHSAVKGSRPETT
jgi:hypothetical protein